MSSASKPNDSGPQSLSSAVASNHVARLESMIESHGMARQPPTPSSSDSVVGEVVDTHHPHRPGRVCVRWRDVAGAVQEHWLVYDASLRPEPGRHVVLSRPSNWPEWIVTSMLSVSPSSSSREVLASSDRPGVQQVVRLEESEALRVESSQGALMFELLQTADQPVLRLGRDLTIALDGTLRLAADRIEMRSGAQGTDLRSEGSTVLRSPQVRIN